MTKDVKPTEKELLSLLSRQNEKAFGYLYDQFAPVLYGIILREVKNQKLASEILKNTFINIFADCKNIDCIKQSLFTWLLMMVKKTASTNFEVDIDLRSLLVPGKNSSENYIQKNVNYDGQYSSPNSFFKLNTLR